MSGLEPLRDHIFKNYNQKQTIQSFDDYYDQEKFSTNQEIGELGLQEDQIQINPSNEILNQFIEEQNEEQV